MDNRTRKILNKRWKGISFKNGKHVNTWKYQLWKNTPLAEC